MSRSESLASPPPTKAWAISTAGVGSETRRPARSADTLFTTVAIADACDRCNGSSDQGASVTRAASGSRYGTA